jgi:exopolysaccharide production protein ExoQ
LPARSTDTILQEAISSKAGGTWLIDGCWLAFLVIASGAGFSYTSFDMGRLAWLVVDIVVIYSVARSPQAYLQQANSIPALMSWPLLAIASTFWSLTPELSAYHGFQLLATYLVGFYLISRYGLLTIGKLLYLTLAIGATLSSVAIAIQHPLARDGEMWMGVFSHKNTLGHFMSLEIILGTLFLWVGWHRIPVSLITILAAVLLAYSRSADAVVLLGAVLLALLFLVLVIHPRSRLIGIFAFGTIGASAAIVLFAYQVDPFRSLLDALGKDNSLTGRTTLWSFGIEAFWRSPLYGIGYKAYWESPATTSSDLVAIMNQDLKSFHNNLLDVSVALGVLGATVFILALVSVLISTVRAYVRAPSALALWPFAFTLFVAVQGIAEYPLFMNHSFEQLVLVMVAAGVQTELRALAGNRNGVAARNWLFQPASPTL